MWLPKLVTVRYCTESTGTATGKCEKEKKECENTVQATWFPYLMKWNVKESGHLYLFEHSTLLLRRIMCIFSTVPFFNTPFGFIESFLNFYDSLLMTTTKRSHLII